MAGTVNRAIAAKKKGLSEAGKIGGELERKRLGKTQ